MCLSELLEFCPSFEPGECSVLTCDDQDESPDEVNLRVRKNRQRKSRKTRTSSPTSVTCCEARPYADEMKTHQEKNVAVKMLVNYLPDYKNEDTEEDVSKKWYSKKLRENDIHRERRYKQYNLLL